MKTILDETDVSHTVEEKADLKEALACLRKDDPHALAVAEADQYLIKSLEWCLVPDLEEQALVHVNDVFRTLLKRNAADRVLYAENLQALVDFADSMGIGREERPDQHEWMFQEQSISAARLEWRCWKVSGVQTDVTSRHASS
jgi:hypothetical protein